VGFEVRLDPDDGTPPAILGFEEYQAIFPALVAVSPSFLAPLKRLRGPHARFDLPADAMRAVLQETTALRQRLGRDTPFLRALADLATRALATGAGLHGRSP
jgi:hypothetical protein